MFITLEGPDGAGKSTQSLLLYETLNSHGLDVILTREPGGTELGNRLRDLLLDGRLDMFAATEAYLMTAARAEHVCRVIEPALTNGKIVICDRFADSTLAYQGAGRGLDESELRMMQSLALGDVWPDLTILLDIDSEESMQRKVGVADRNRLDDEPLEFHRRVCAWYRDAAHREPERWRIVNAGRPISEVAHDVCQVVFASLSVAGCQIASRLPAHEGER